MRLSRRGAAGVGLRVPGRARAAGAGGGSAPPGAGAPAPASVAVDDASTGEAAALLANVQDAAGAPLPGRDPSMEVQTTLDEAVARSSLTKKAVPKGDDRDAMTAQEMANKGVGTKAERKAAGAAAAKKVLGNPKASGVLSNGCATGYGEVTQCVPAKAPGGGTTTGEYVVTVFPQGIAVTGKDSLGLDADGNGTACDAGDLAHHHH